MRHQDLPDFTLVCQDQAFRLHKDRVCKQSPVLREALNKAYKELQSFVIHVTDFSAITVKHMVDFLYLGNYGVNEDELPSYTRAKPVLSSGGARPKELIQDLLLRHIEVNAIGVHYKIPDLCELAMTFIQSILQDDWHDSVFLAVAAAAAAKSTDQNLRDMLRSCARAHLESLTKFPEFKASMVFKGLVGSAPPTSTIDPTDSFDTPDTSIITDSTGSTCAADNHRQLEELSPMHAWTAEDHALMNEELERLKAQVKSLGENALVVSSERDHLQQRIKSEENKAAQSALKLDQSIRNLHEKELNKSSSLAKNYSELEQALKLEKQKSASDSNQQMEKAENALLVMESKLMAVTSQRDSLNEAWEKGKSELSSVKKELEVEKHKKKEMSLDERDRLQRTLGAETYKITTLTRELEEAKRAEAAALARESEAQRAENMAKAQKPTTIKKINNLVRQVNQNKKCRQCGKSFARDSGTRVEDTGDVILLRCADCRTRHY
ncbi:hypothetical protein ACHAPJ_008841 [Fusarium lateritium]